MKVYIERTVSPPLEADQVRDKSRVGEGVFGEPFRVLDLLESSPMTWQAAEQFGRVWLTEQGPHRAEGEPNGLTVRFRDPGDQVLDLVLGEEE